MGAIAKTVLVIGTADTKADELLFMRRCIEDAGGRAPIMDVGILGTPPFSPEYPNREVAAAANTTIAAIAASADENEAMAKMAQGAAVLTRRLHDEGRFDGVLILGGTMGTDLALDVALALPLGVPKAVVSTVSFSHLIPPERIATDLMMVLWAGGLYGLNSICETALSQACGAVLGACATVKRRSAGRPVIGMTSLGKSCLNYMVALKPALEGRGYELAVFHTTGMGGRAFEQLAREKHFAAVMDFSLQELANHLSGSVVTAGADRLEGAGAAGVPQIVAPGAIDMIDFPTWTGGEARYPGRPYHAHNRLIASVTMNAEERRAAARAIAQKLGKARGPTAFILPARGIQAWDVEGEGLYDPQATDAFMDEARRAVPKPLLHEIDAHINDTLFADTALAIFDQWVRDGLVPKGAA